LQTTFGRADRDEHGTLITSSAPGEWLLSGATGQASALAARVPRAGFTVIVDLTHGRALVRLTGPETTGILSKVCAMDLREWMTPNGATFRCSVAGMVTDLVRDDRDGINSYLLHCERSSGQFLVNSLVDDGAEFGLSIHGYVSD
jgi:heterotetrameric sarcosine oxidase gamma subunit